MNKQHAGGSMSCAEVRELLGALCRDELSQEDAARTRRHLRGCPACMESLSRHVASEVAAGHPEYLAGLEAERMGAEDLAVYTCAATSFEGMEVVDVDWARIEREWLDQEKGDVGGKSE